MTARAAIVVVGLVLALAACAPTLQPPGPYVDAPRAPSLDVSDAPSDDGLRRGALTARDGTALPVRRWGSDAPTLVVAALHGMNDYSNAFAAPAAWWGARGAAVYAIDQRGFGDTEHRGLWAGWTRMRDDAVDLVAALRARHPDARLMMLGLSMGGAVAMTAMAEGADADGVVLAAPAVWSRATMPWWQTAALWITVRVAPGMTLTGRGLNIRPSDNVPMLRALSADPLVIKETRVDAMWGVTNLMDAATEAAGALNAPTLILYGEKDEIIPRAAVDRALERFPKAAADRPDVRFYPGQYHMILRGLDAQTVWADALAWMRDDARAGGTAAARR